MNDRTASGPRQDEMPRLLDYVGAADLERLAAALVEMLISARERRAASRGQGSAVEQAPPKARPTRPRALKPSCLAKWEAHWQSEGAPTEAER